MMRAARRLLQEVPAKRPSPANDIFALRRAPNSLHVAGMQSNTLSDHPVTHRAAQNELSFKQRKLMERGEFEKAAAVEAEADAREQEGKSGGEAKEYRNVLMVAAAGYVTAHAVVYKYYYPEDVPFSYQPDRGYSEDIAARREVMQHVDELVGLSVLDAVFSKAKAKHKTPLTEQLA